MTSNDDDLGYSQDELKILGALIVEEQEMLSLAEVLGIDVAELLALRRTQQYYVRHQRWQAEHNLPDSDRHHLTQLHRQEEVYKRSSEIGWVREE